MGAFFVYILKSSFCLVLFYLFYRLLLSRETFLRFNRLALLGIVILSITIPLCEITTQQPVMLQHQIMNLENLFRVTPDTDSGELLPSLWLQFVLFIYICGILFFISRIIYSFSHMLRIVWMGKKTNLGNGIYLVTSKEIIAPFSWMKYIVISQPDQEENKEVILTHELAHVQAFHSLDLLLSEFCIVFHWFNPASWLLKQEIQNNHEYQADEQVIRQGVDAKKYQLLLIEKAVGAQRFTSMANSFNHSKLKKRITMMLKKKSNPLARLKYLYILPLTTFAVIAFARPEISREFEKISSVKISEIIPVKESAPTVLKEVIITPGKPQIAKQTNARLLQKDEIIQVEEVGEQKPTYEVVAPQQLISIDNVKSSYDEMDKLSRYKIKSVSILKENSILKYGANTRSVATVVSTSNKSAERPMILIEGKEFPYEKLSQMDPEEIESISVWKNQKAIERFGEKGKNGVIEVIIKKK